MTAYFDSLRAMVQQRSDRQGAARFAPGSLRDAPDPQLDLPPDAASSMPAQDFASDGPPRVQPSAMLPARPAMPGLPARDIMDADPAKATASPPMPVTKVAPMPAPRPIDPAPAPRPGALPVAGRPDYDARDPDRPSTATHAMPMVPDDKAQPRAPQAATVPVSQSLPATVPTAAVPPRLTDKRDANGQGHVFPAPPWPDAPDGPQAKDHGIAPVAAPPQPAFTIGEVVVTVAAAPPPQPSAAPAMRRQPAGLSAAAHLRRAGVRRL